MARGGDPMDRPVDLAGAGVTWLTLGQAAKHVGVAERTLRRWADDGRLPAFSTVGGHRRFRLTDLEAYLHGARVSTGADDERRAVVLLVDDDSRRRAAVSSALEADGCDVAEVTSAEAALRAVQETAPDLILMNVALEGIDGLELLCRLRESHGLESVSVLMFTARAGKSGVRRTMIGPPQPGRLIDAARRVLAAAPASKS
jgi:excisionase family DNA binding protein